MHIKLNTNNETMSCMAWMLSLGGLDMTPDVYPTCSAVLYQVIFPMIAFASVLWELLKSDDVGGVGDIEVKDTCCFLYTSSLISVKGILFCAFV